MPLDSPATDRSAPASTGRAAWLVVIALLLGACSTAGAPQAAGVPGAVAGADGAGESAEAAAQQASAPLADGPAPGQAQAPAPPPGPQMTVAPWEDRRWDLPPEEDTPVKLWIPAARVWADIGELGLRDDDSIEVPQSYGDTGYYIHGPRPGETGPSVVAGHVDSRTGPAVFHLLPDLQPRHLAHVFYRSGYVATFVVNGVEQYPKDQFPTERVYGNTDNAQIRLITCGGDFDGSIGHYTDNIVVFGEIYGTWTYDWEAGTAAPQN